MNKFNPSNDGFNRYMAVDPDGDPQWESGFSAGTCEEDAWCDFFDWCLDGDHGGIADHSNAIKTDDDVDYMQQMGWRMVECEPRPIDHIDALKAENAWLQDELRKIPPEGIRAAVADVAHESLREIGKLENENYALEAENAALKRVLIQSVMDAAISGKSVRKIHCLTCLDTVPE